MNVFDLKVLIVIDKINAVYHEEVSPFSVTNYLTYEFYSKNEKVFEISKIDKAFNLFNDLCLNGFNADIANMKEFDDYQMMITRHIDGGVLYIKSENDVYNICLRKSEKGEKVFSTFTRNTISVSKCIHEIMMHLEQGS